GVDQVRLRADARNSKGPPRNISGDVLFSRDALALARLKKASDRSTPTVLSGLAMRDRSRVVKPGPHPRSIASRGRFRTVSQRKASLVESKTSETIRSLSAARFVSPKE